MQGNGNVSLRSVLAVMVARTERNLNILRELQAMAEQLEIPVYEQISAQLASHSTQLFTPVVQPSRSNLENGSAPKVAIAKDITVTTAENVGENDATDGAGSDEDDEKIKIFKLDSYFNLCLHDKLVLHLGEREVMTVQDAMEAVDASYSRLHSLLSQKVEFREKTKVQGLKGGGRNCILYELSDYGKDRFAKLRDTLFKDAGSTTADHKP